VAQTWSPRVNDSQADSLGISSSALPLLRDLIHERTGVFFDNGRYDALRDRLAPLVVDRGFDSFLDYFYLLKYDEGAAEDWGRVTDALAVPETYFWREMDQIHGVVTHVVPGLAKTRGFEPLRIWSVPSASGEEPLTIAMRLEEDGWFDRLPIEIHGSDASPAAIARARAGRYRERSFRTLPPALREKYFRRDGDAWTVTPALQRRMTSWSVVNLLDDQAVGARAGVPIVFCRNVFIYFSDAAVRRVVDRFAAAMPVPAYLCVGASESLLRVASRFELEEVGAGFAYVKRR
jgi:chemotaxis protein methyltransferase CheR